MNDMKQACWIGSPDEDARKINRSLVAYTSSAPVNVTSKSDVV